MENMDVLVRGVVMQNQGIGLGLISLASVEWAWVAVVATIVMAFVSVRRVSIFSVGLTWRGKPGQMRVQVQSFSSSLDGNCIVTARGMFSAGLMKSSEPEAEVSSECCGGGGASSNPSSKVAAEMFFVFEKKTTSVVVPKLTSALRTEKTKVQRRVRRLSKLHTVAYMDPQPNEGTISVSRREGIEWDPGTSPHILSSSSSSENIDFLLPSWAQTLAKPLVAYRTPYLVAAESSTTFSSGWDPLLKLKIRDAVLCGDRKCFSSTTENLKLSPVVAKDGNNLVSLKNDVVRLWDRNAKSEVKRVYLPKRSLNVNALTSAFDVDWDTKRAALGGVDGMLSFIDLERPAFEKSYQTQQAVVQALQFDRNSSMKTALVGGPAIATSGCSVSLWDMRTSDRQIDANLNANLIYGLRAQGNKLYIRDDLKYVSLHDVRMLKGSNVSRIPCGVNSELKVLAKVEDQWWDVDAACAETDEDVDDDEFWDCQSANSEGKESGKPSMVGNFVMAVSRSFSSKSLGRPTASREGFSTAPNEEMHPMKKPVAFSP